MPERLPIDAYADQLSWAVKNYPVTVLVGDTGCGKTTRLPHMLLAAGFGARGVIACTEPRRIAAITAASRVASEQGEVLGEKVGFHVRFEQQKSAATRVLFMTDGVLMQESRSDPLLRRYAVVIVDEAHERNLYSDFTCAYLKALLARRDDLRVIISSATIDPVQFMAYFRTIGLVRVPGRLFPISLEYRERGLDIIRQVAEEVRAVHQARPPGDILVFLPGVGEIRAAHKALQQMRLRSLDIMFLYGGMEPYQQEQVFAPSRGRKVILATNVAETSITIPGIRYVMDSGLARQPGYDAVRGVDTLSLTRISQSAATQRVGRAGRTEAGIGIRLYSEDEFKSMPKKEEPEIARSDLTGLVLTARRYDIERVANLDLPTRPPRHAEECATATLKAWGALDDLGNLTAFGKQLTTISLEPMLARFVVMGAEEGCLKEAATIAAFLSVRNLFFREGGVGGFVDMVPRMFEDPMGDLFSYLRIWCSYQAPQTHPSGWCRQYRINPRVMRGVCSIRAQVIREALRAGLDPSSSTDRDVIGRTIVRAFGHNHCVYAGNRRYRSGNREGIRLARSSSLTRREPREFVAVGFMDTGTVWAVGAVEVQPEWRDLLPSCEEESRITGVLPFPIRGTIHLTEKGHTRTVQVNYHPERERAATMRTVMYGALALDVSALPFLDTTRIRALADVPKAVPLTHEERFAPFPIVMEEDTELRVELAAAAPVLTDRLLERFMDQPIQMLELSSGVVMKLLAGGVITIRNITEMSAEQLRGGQGSARGATHRPFKFPDLPQFTDREADEIKQRLAAYGLTFSNQWQLHDALLMPDAVELVHEKGARVSEDAAREILGDETFELFKRMREGKSIAARNAIVTRNVGLAWDIGIRRQWSIPKWLQDTANEGADYAQEGSIGLMRAVIAFDPLRGYRFSTYATQWVRQAISRCLANSGTIRVPVHQLGYQQQVLKRARQFGHEHGRPPSVEELAPLMSKEPEHLRAILDELRMLQRMLRLDQPVHGGEQDDNEQVFADIVPDHQDSAEVMLFEHEFVGAVNRMVREAPITDIDRRILELKFGLNGEDSHTLKEIGVALGLTQEAIRQHLARTLDMMRTRGNWEMMRNYRGLQPLEQGEGVVWRDRVVECTLEVLLRATDKWGATEYLQVLTEYLGIPLSALASGQTGVALNQARVAAAALLWCPVGLELDEIATRLTLTDERAAHKAISKFRVWIEKRGWAKLAEAYVPPVASSTDEAVAEEEPEVYAGVAYVDDEEPEEAVPLLTEEQIVQVRALLDQVELTPRHRFILENRLPLGKPSLKFRELGAALGVTRQMAQTIQKAAIRRVVESQVYEEHRTLLEPLLQGIMRKGVISSPPATSVPVATVEKDEDPVEVIYEFQHDGHVDSFKVVAWLARHFHLTVQDLRSGMRVQPVAHARQVVMYVLRELGCSFTSIALELRRKDHTTVMHGVKKIAEMMEEDPAFARQVARLVAHVTESKGGE